MTTYLNQNGKEALKWECCPLQSSNYEKIIHLTKQGKALKEIIFEVGIDKSNVSKYQKRPEKKVGWISLMGTDMKLLRVAPP